MNMSHIRSALAVMVLVAASSACHEQPKEKASNAAMAQSKPADESEVRTDVVALARMISLPREPRSVKWQTTKGHRDDWALTALLEFAPEDLSAIVAESQQLNGTAHISQKFTPWFPDDFRAAHAGLPVRPDGIIEFADGARIRPTSFTAAKLSPLKHGIVEVFEKEGLAFVHLYTM
ncbi:MAG: hypothetical protein RL701_8110 [Pseudomonadota bacterium]|jgi:hypothetical protein